MGCENQRPLAACEVDDELRSIVSKAWKRTNLSRWQFTRLLRNEAKAVVFYHDPAACTRDERLRDDLKRHYRSTSLSRSEYSRQLRELAQVYENMVSTDPTPVSVVTKE
jgi:hypothetical protein